MSSVNAHNIATLFIIITTASIFHLSVLISAFTPTLSIQPLKHCRHHQIKLMKTKTTRTRTNNSLIPSNCYEKLDLIHLNYASSSNQNNDNNDDDGDQSMEKRNVQLQLNQKMVNEDEDKNKKISKNEEIIDPIYILPIVTTMSILVVSSILLYNKITNPTTSFDIDFYMALDGTLKSNNEINSIGIDELSSSSSGGAQFESITGLPPLSPAEKIVGAFFGPPSGNHY